MFLNAAIIGALVLALVLRFGQRAEVAAWAFSYLMLLLVRPLLSRQRAARRGPGRWPSSSRSPISWIISATSTAFR